MMNENRLSDAIASARNSISAQGELLLYGVIGDWWDDLDANTVVAQLESMDGPEISVRIHSDGGYITEGIVIYNRLKASSKTVRVVIDGLAASMASVIAMAGDHVAMHENGWLMIHKPWNSVSGDADELRHAAGVLDTMEADLLDIYHKKTGLPLEQLTEMLAAETWINAKDALELGFIDEILEPVTAVASRKLDQFGNVPEAVNALFNQKPTAAVAVKPKQDVDTMTEEDKNAAAKAKADAQAKHDASEAAQNAVVAERARAASIREIGATAKLDSDAVNSMIDRGISEDKARAEALEAMAKRDQENMPASSRVNVHTDSSRMANAVTNAIMNRVNPGANSLSEDGREFQHMTLMDMARDMIEAGGLSARGKSPMEIAGLAMHTTSDFPLILADVANTTLRDAYASVSRTFTPFSRRTTANDFKAKHVVALGEAPDLKPVNEKGEFTRGTIGEEGESYKLRTYGRIIGMSRQMFINDDLDAFSRVASMFGSSAARLENKIVWDILTGNPKMGDGKALFHADHRNLATGNALTEAGLSEARKKFRMQYGLDKTDPLGIEAMYLIVPAALETTAQKLLSAIVANTTGDVNVFANSLTLIVEPRLDINSETTWYLAASPSSIDTIEYCYLAGEEGVFTETQVGFEVDGVDIKARLDFGAAPVDFRGLQKSTK